MPCVIPDRAIPQSEVAQHNSKGDCWLIIHGAVCDVTEWIPDHPGGGEMLIKKAGKDATMQFKLSHPAYVLQDQVQQWAIGYVEGAKLGDGIVVKGKGDVVEAAPRAAESTPGCFAKIMGAICG
ncbi:unnamed protein product [Amoebophrya sp. A25]|nr:unnamed protein product [Amoebophrya sp. A25]|eukprot:GSA25T00000472001.1